MRKKMSILGFVFTTVIALIGLVVILIKECNSEKKLTVELKGEIIEPQKENFIINNDRLPPPQPLSLASWYSWPDKDTITVTRGAKDDEWLLNSRGRMSDAAGIVNENLGTALRGKFLILFFSNTRESDFSEGRMFKLECDDSLLSPENRTPSNDFISVEDTPSDMGIKYKIPDNFDGKLNLVFYQAELRNLLVSVYYQ